MYPNLKNTCHIKLKFFLHRELTPCKIPQICQCPFKEGMLHKHAHNFYWKSVFKKKKIFLAISYPVHYLGLPHKLPRTD